MTTKGFVGVEHLFYKNAYCNYNNNNDIKITDIITLLYSDGINKFKYDNLTHSSTIIDNDTILIQTYGSCEAILYNFQSTNINLFVETFVLKNMNDKYLIINYLFKII